MAGGAARGAVGDVRVAVHGSSSGMGHDGWGLPGMRLTVYCQMYTVMPVSPAVTPEDAWTRFAMSVFKVNGLIIRAGEGITNPIGQSSARWQVLGRAHQPTTVAKMAQDIGHARQSVQRIADILAAEGLVSYQDNPADRRARFVELTAVGANVLGKIYQRQVDWSLRIMQQLSPTQLVQIANGLEGIAQVLESSIYAGEEG
jgi:DNA-binding MarR family transcriptional regulator